jgi:hypothetical protein
MNRMFLGLFIIILIPEFASTTHFVLQGLLGLWLVFTGAHNLLENAN